MSNWDTILNDAEWLAEQFRRRAVDLAEAEKVGDYYLGKKCDDGAVTHYLDLMAIRPPVRSKRSQSHFKNIRDIWHTWRSDLKGRDKARAWGWGIRQAKSLRGSN